MESGISIPSRRLFGRLAMLTAVIVVAILTAVWYRSRAAHNEVETPRIGTIDYYGLHTVTMGQLQGGQAIKQIPGVVRARITRVQNAGSDQVSLFVGIEENSAPHFEYRLVPAVRLPSQSR